MREPVSRGEVAILVAVMALGAFLRLWQIAELPPGLFYDEAIYGLDSLAVLREKGWPLFFTTEGHMREPLYMYIQAIALAIGGVSATTIRVTSALLGTLTIPVVWLLAREWRGPRFALLAILFFTPLRWHVHFSRTAFRVILSPLFASLAFWLFARALRVRTRSSAIAAGAAIGAGLYTYLSMRLIPFIIGAGCLVALWQARRRGEPLPPLLRSALVGMATALLVFAPLGLDFLRHPEHFSGRSEEVSILWGADRQPSLLLSQARDVALMGILRGDHVGKHNIPGGPGFSEAYLLGPDPSRWRESWLEAKQAGTLPDVHGTGIPVFDVITGLFFYAGLVVWLVRAARGGVLEATALAWLLLGSLASIASFGAPNMLRLLFLSPLAALAVATAMELVLSRPARKGASLAIVLLLWTWFAAGETWRYFHTWASHPRPWYEFNTDVSEIARFLRRDPRTPPAVIFPEAVISHSPTLKFEADGVGIRADKGPPPTGDRFWFLASEIEGYPVVYIPWARDWDMRPIESFTLPEGEVWARLIEARRPGSGK